jgi:CHAT domain-containing protein
MSANLDDVDLLTLSACATELTDKADGTEFEGLGALFQKKGAKAVIGTLWPVQDEGGAALMKAFYAARGEQRQMSKAAALQDAQIQLLTGKIKSSNLGIDLTQPYYWAPFILMGNWL